MIYKPTMSVLCIFFILTNVNNLQLQKFSVDFINSSVGSILFPDSTDSLPKNQNIENQPQCVFVYLFTIRK